jgi:hypothetical protein
MKRKVTFSQQLTKITGAYHRKELCLVHLQHAFATVLLNGRQAWVSGVELEPGITFEEQIKNIERPKMIQGLEGLFQSIGESIEQIERARASQNPMTTLFWENGGKFVIDHSDAELVYISDLIAKNESGGLYTTEHIVQLQNTFTQTWVRNIESDNADFLAIEATLQVLADIHARTGEDVLAWELVARKN